MTDKTMRENETAKPNTKMRRRLAWALLFLLPLAALAMVAVWSTPLAAQGAALRTAILVSLGVVREALTRHGDPLLGIEELLLGDDRDAGEQIGPIDEHREVAEPCGARSFEQRQP